MSDLENSHRRSILAQQAITQMYADYWRGCLGPYLQGAPKEPTHEGIAQFLSDCTMNAIGEMETARAIIGGIEKWKADAAVARTLGVPEPSPLGYLPHEARAAR